MNNNLVDRFKKLRGKSYLGAALLLLMLVIGVGIWLTTPKRSVESFCKVYKEQKAKITSSSGPTELAAAFSKLDQVAPKDVEPNTKSLKQIFQKVSKDPSQTFSGSLSGIGYETNIEIWATRHCGDQ